MLRSGKKCHTTLSWSHSRPRSHHLHRHWRRTKRLNGSYILILKKMLKRPNRDQLGGIWPFNSLQSTPQGTLSSIYRRKLSTSGTLSMYLPMSRLTLLAFVQGTASLIQTWFNHREGPKQLSPNISTLPKASHQT